MRPTEVTDAEINEAGERLMAAGKRVSGWTLRAALGNRGKPDRLLAVWTRHVAGDAAESTEPTN